MLDGSVHVSGGGGYPPGGGGPPGGGWGPPPGAPPGGGGYGPPGGPPPGGQGPGAPPGAPPGGWGPPPGAPPGAPPGYGPPGGPGGPGIPGGPPPPQGPPPGYGPPGGPPGGLPPGYQPPGAPPPGAPGYGPPGGPPGGLPPGYVPPGQQPPPPGGGYGPPGGGGAPGGGYAPPGYGPPAGGYGPPGAPGGGFGGPPPGGYGGGFVPPGGAAPTVSGSAWSPVDALGFAWNALMKNFAGVSLPIATAVVILVVPVYGGIFALALMASVVAEFVDPAFIGLFNILAQACIGGLGLLIGTFLAGGVTEFSLKVARGQPVAFGDVFSGGKYFGSVLVGSIGFLVCAAIGGLLCVIPGYIVQFGLWPFAFIIVDQKLGGIDALKKAWAMTNGHKLSIFVFWLLSIVVVIAGELACLIGALLVSAPMLAIANAHLYLSLKGEPPRLQ